MGSTKLCLLPSGNGMHKVYSFTHSILFYSPSICLLFASYSPSIPFYSPFILYRPHSIRLLFCSPSRDANHYLSYHLYYVLLSCGWLASAPSKSILELLFLIKRLWILSNSNYPPPRFYLSLLLSLFFIYCTLPVVASPLLQFIDTGNLYTFYYSTVLLLLDCIRDLVVLFYSLIVPFSTSLPSNSAA